MTLEDVQAALSEIRAVVDDPEAAHGLEDKLRAKVLRVIADGSPDAPALARMVLEAQGIDFERFCA